VELRGEDLSCYLNNIRSVGLWKCPHDHWLVNKAYFSASRLAAIPIKSLSDITVKIVSKSFTHKMAAEASWHWNYVTVTLCIPSPTHSFIPGLKPSFSANPSHCSPSFLLLEYLLRGFSGLFTVISEHICFLLLVFFLFLHF